MYNVLILRGLVYTPPAVCTAQTGSLYPHFYFLFF